MERCLMKIIYVTNTKKDSQCDYQEVSMLYGLREVMGDDCIDFPRKKIMYGDFSESPKDELHGWGFSLLTYPIEEISNREVDEVDFVLYGVTDAYGVINIPEVDSLAKYGVWYLDGHDHNAISKTPSFKTELFDLVNNRFILEAFIICKPFNRSLALYTILNAIASAEIYK